MPITYDLYLNRNPRGTPCPECRRYIGHKYLPRQRPHLPRHQHCYCYYQRIIIQDPQTDPQPDPQPAPKPPPKKKKKKPKKKPPKKIPHPQAAKMFGAPFPMVAPYVQPSKAMVATLLKHLDPDLAVLGALQREAPPHRREEIYLARFILGQTYARWDRDYLPLAGRLLDAPLRLSDRGDQALSSAGVKIDDVGSIIAAREGMVVQVGKRRFVRIGE